MKESEVKSFYVSKPFAVDENSRNELPSDAGSLVNLQTGFTPNYAVPSTAGGSQIKRKDLNALGYMATMPSFLNTIGKVNTFDENVCRSIGGYPKNAVLDYIVSGSLYKCISLVDDNNFDFRVNMLVTETGYDETTVVARDEKWLMIPCGNHSNRCMPDYGKARSIYYGTKKGSSTTNEVISLSDGWTITMPFDGYILVDYHCSYQGSPAFCGIAFGPANGNLPSVTTFENTYDENLGYTGIHTVSGDRCVRMIFASQTNTIDRVNDGFPVPAGTKMNVIVGTRPNSSFDYTLGIYAVPTVG